MTDYPRVADPLNDDDIFCGEQEGADAGEEEDCLLQEQPSAESDSMS